MSYGVVMVEMGHHANLHTFVYTFIHMYVRTLMHKCIYPYVCTHIRAVGNCLANDS